MQNLDRPVTVAVLTFRREAMLATLLSALGRQLEALEPPAGSRVLVVDNDPDGSAESVAEAAGVVYAHEPTPGIAAARQCALDRTPAPHLLAFIDDDELPREGWLELLVRTWLDHGRPAAVAGRVVPRYEVPPSEWIEAGGFFVRRSLPTGTRVDAAGAGNLLLDMEQVGTLSLSFDASLGMRGGEDTLFTRQLTKRGGVIVWCEEAQAEDLVPADRANRRWVLRRGFSHGLAHSMVTVRLEEPGPALVTRARLVITGVGRVAVGLVAQLVGRLRRNVPGEARGLWLAWRGAGITVGALGVGWAEYSRAPRSNEDT